MATTRRTFRKEALASTNPAWSEVLATARSLKEANPDAIATMAMVHHALGAEGFKTVLAETQAVEGQGGLLTQDNQRRRTPGGVFLHLSRQQVPLPVRWWIFEHHLPRPTAAWPQRLNLRKNPPPTSAARVVASVTGTIESFMLKGALVEFWLAVNPGASGTPKGLPRPSQWPSSLKVRCAYKAWRHIADANLKQKVRAEGFPQLGAAGLELWAERLMLLNSTNSAP